MNSGLAQIKKCCNICELQTCKIPWDSVIRFIFANCSISCRIPICCAQDAAGNFWQLTARRGRLFVSTAFTAVLEKYHAATAKASRVPAELGTRRQNSAQSLSKADYRLLT